MEQNTEEVTRDQEMQTGLTSPMRQHGQADSIRLNAKGRHFFSHVIPDPDLRLIDDIDLGGKCQHEIQKIADHIFESTPERLIQLRTAEELKPSFLRHLDWLEKLSRRIESQLDRLSRPKFVARFRIEFVNSVPGYSSIFAMVFLLWMSNWILNKEFEVAIASVIQGPWFETPSSNEAMPYIEPTRAVAMGVALAPVIGLLISMEFISFTAKKRRVRLHTRALGISSFSLSLLSIWLFAYLVNLPIDFGEDELTNPTMPWYGSALFMTVMSMSNAILLHGFFWLAKQTLELSPSDTRWDARLVAELHRVSQAIADTRPSLGIIEAVIDGFYSGKMVFQAKVLCASEKRYRKRQIRDLQCQIDKLID